MSAAGWEGISTTKSTKAFLSIEIQIALNNLINLEVTYGFWSLLLEW